MLDKQDILLQLKDAKPNLEAIGINSIGLFGSYARNENTASSDIDILIDFNAEQETFNNLMLASDLFEKIFIKERVELVTKKSLSQYLKPYILNEVIYV